MPRYNCLKRIKSYEKCYMDSIWINLFRWKLINTSLLRCQYVSTTILKIITVFNYLFPLSHMFAIILQTIIEIFWKNLYCEINIYTYKKEGIIFRFKENRKIPVFYFQYQVTHQSNFNFLLKSYTITHY